MDRTLRNIEVCRLSNGHELHLTLHEFTNNKSGPTLGLSATIHGNENLAIETLRRFSLELKDLNFKGKILMLPVANPLALGSSTYKNPIDMNNLSTCFPGSETGEVSQQIANAIVKEYMSHADYFIDFHSAGDKCTVDYTVTYPGSEELGKMAGQKYIYLNPDRPGSMSAYLATQNKPMIVTEFGGGNQNNKYYIQQGLKSIKNIMKYLKMIDGKPDIPGKQYLLKERITIRAKNGGILRPCFSLDSMHSIVNKSDLLGITYSPYTFEEIEHFYGPFNKNIIIMLKPDIGRIEAGDFLFMLSDSNTIEKI